MIHLIVRRRGLSRPDLTTARANSPTGYPVHRPSAALTCARKLPRLKRARAAHTRPSGVGCVLALKGVIASSLGFRSRVLDVDLPRFQPG